VDRLPDPMRWLAAGVPLTLLIDLFGTAGPDSAAILADEPADAGWVSELRAA
jgi:hypothetical protein